MNEERKDSSSCSPTHFTEMLPKLMKYIFIFGKQRSCHSLALVMFIQGRILKIFV